MNSDRWLKDLYDANYSMLYRVASNRLRLYSGNTSDVQDILQEVFLLAVKKDISTHPNPEGWLIKATVNVCKEYVRASKRHERRANKRMQQNITHTPPPTSNLSEDIVDVRMLIECTFSKSDQELIEQYCFLELSVEQIAQQLKISENAVRIRIHRIRNKLKDIL